MKTLSIWLFLSLAALPAAAQTRPSRPAGPPRDSRGFIAINGLAQNSAGTRRDNFTYEAFAETGTIDAEYPGKTAVMFDVGGGMRVWRRLGVGVTVSRATASGRAPLSARVPHPLYNNQHREVTGEAGGIDRTETAAHVQLYYDFPSRGKLRVRLSAGPSYFNAEQQVIESIETSETYPYDTTEFGTAVVRKASGSGPGINAGIDLAWMFTRRLGVGAVTRFTRGAFDLNANGSRRVPSDVGGIQAGGGVRIAF